MLGHDAAVTAEVLRFLRRRTFVYRRRRRWDVAFLIVTVVC